VLFGKLLQNTLDFLGGLPVFLTEGYARTGRGNDIRDHLDKILLITPGVIYALMRRSLSERLFWLGLIVSTILSAAIIMGDDGWRTLHVSHVLLAMFVAFGFTAPGVLTAPPKVFVRPSLQRCGGAIALVALLYLVVPLLSRQLFGWEVSRHASVEQPGPDSVVLLGAGRLTGFVVVPDGTPQAGSVPAMSLSEFKKLIAMTGLEKEFGEFVEAQAEHLPFGFVTSGLFQFSSPPWFPSALFIVPPEVLEGRDAWAWRLKLIPAGPGMDRSNLLKAVETAQPLK
jgi:hypothetical protein